MSITIRPIEKCDIERCGQIGYEAHSNISSIHGYPSEQPSEEFGIELIRKLIANPNSWGVLAERQGKVLGSIFLHRFPPSPVAAIGPLTVRPSAEGGIGKYLMDAALDQARSQKNDQVRLVQSPSHIRSFALYTKSGFSLREPLFLMQGQPLRDDNSEKGNVRLVSDDNDVLACNNLCMSVHGFSRELELQQAKDQGMAMMVERNRIVTGYAAGIGLFGHAVAETNEDMKALIASATSISGPGFLVPARNRDLINWLFENGMRIAWPANLMTRGQYKDPSGPFIPSLAY